MSNSIKHQRIIVISKQIYLSIKMLIIRLFVDKEYLLRIGDTNQVLKISKRYLEEKINIIEAGAFNGDDTKRISHYFPKSEIYAFEPVPENFKMLINNTKNNSNIHCFELALSDTEGIVKFYNSHSIKKPDKSAAGSLLAPKEHLNFAPHVSFNKITEIKSTTLDAWASNNRIENIDFLWLDMQGMELRVLKQSPNILKTVKIIYIEVIFIEAYEKQHIYYEIRKFLEDSGFRVVAKNFLEKDAKYPKVNKRWFGDVLFTRDINS